MKGNSIVLMNEILQKIDDAEMILIGLGEEFDDSRSLKQDQQYTINRDMIINSSFKWLLPAYQNCLREQMQDKVYNGLDKLANIIENKNYFVISTSMNDVIRDVSWKKDRLVTTCGGSRWKQCSNGCEEGLIQLDTSEIEHLKMMLCEKKVDEKWTNKDFALGSCPKCGSPLILNNIYADQYDEKGYLGQWSIYTKWLQGTLNKKLLILELGVGMQFPSVIRWPFEKIAFYNAKAEFYRINKNLYHLTEELSEKGHSISENAIDWLQFLC